MLPLLIIYMIVSLSEIESFNLSSYCDPDLCHYMIGRKHIGCNWNRSFGENCPKGVEQIPMTSDLINLIVGTHNERRNYIAGGGHHLHKSACRMATVKWDPELAFLASIAASKCDLSLNKYCSNTKRFAFSGQAVAKLSLNFRQPPEKVIMRSLDIFYSKNKNSNMHHISKYTAQSAQVGLFTLMMIERNIAVGCGLTRYTCDEKRLCHFFVCNYASTNIIDHPVYTACEVSTTGCIKGHNPRYPNLCHPTEEYVINTVV